MPDDKTPSRLFKEAGIDGAAADGVDSEEDFAALPRVLRYAVAARRNRPCLKERLLAEISDVTTEIVVAARSWADDSDDHGVSLAELLDRKAIEHDRPDLRSYADVVRLLSSPLKLPSRDIHRRVALALSMSERMMTSDTSLDLRAEVAGIVIGWAMVAIGAPTDYDIQFARDAAEVLGDKQRRPLIQQAKAEERHLLEVEAARAKPVPATAPPEEDIPPDGDDAFPVFEEGYVRICDLSEAERKNPKLKELVRGHDHVIGVDVRLVEMPELRPIRETLLFEFPYGEQVVDFVLGDLVGRRYVHLRPLLLLGKAGSGKSRFARRLGEELGVGIWHTDASQSDGNVFAGTAKRWYSAEPGHPFLAISRAHVANPLVVIDELEKASTRADYGRLWDSLLGFLETETARRYPDPALQAELDLSHVSYVATANSVEPLPPALRDRFRVVEFPEPRASDLDALLPPVLADIVRERGVTRQWIAPLSQWERDLVAARWRGGSVRRLARFVDVVIRTRERNATRQ